MGQYDTLPYVKSIIIYLKDIPISELSGDEVTSLFGMDIAKLVWTIRENPKEDYDKYLFRCMNSPITLDIKLVEIDMLLKYDEIIKHKALKDTFLLAKSILTRRKRDNEKRKRDNEKEGEMGNVVLWKKEVPIEPGTYLAIAPNQKYIKTTKEIHPVTHVTHIDKCPTGKGWLSGKKDKWLNIVGCSSSVPIGTDDNMRWVNITRLIKKYLTEQEQEDKDDK